MKAAPTTRQILHAACRPAGGATPSERFSPPIDWADVTDRALRLGLVSHLYQFARTGVPGAPADVIERLSTLHLRQAADAVMVHEQLRETVAALHHAGIPVIILKGAALALWIYQDIAVRPMRDLDLLVRHEQLAAAEAVLTAQGYRPDEFYRPRDWWIENHHHLIPLVREGRPVPIELHHDLVPPSSGIVTDLAGLWERAETASVAGVPALVLSQGDLLLHLCQHLDRLVGKLGSVRDLAEVLRQPTPIDWGWLTAAAAKSHSASRTYGALRLARQIAGASIPESALRSFRRAAGFTAVEDVSLDWIAERALTWTDDRGMETAWLTDCGSALLGGKGILSRIATTGEAFYQRVAARGRRGQLAIPSSTRS